MDELIMELERQIDEIWKAAMSSQHAPRAAQLICIYAGICRALLHLYHAKDQG